MPPRRAFVAGNWKMNTDRAGALKLAIDVAEQAAADLSAVELAVFPPFVYLDAIGRALAAADAPVALGAQDLFHEPDGAFTGEISCAMLKDVGCALALTGHSERRHVIGESDALVARKTIATLASGLRCILCVGETIEQRRAGQTDAVNRAQLEAVFDHLDGSSLPALTIAYEPVWAIGTGMTATPQDAQSAHRAIRDLVAARFGAGSAADIRILYGGSVKPSNAGELFSQPDIDGGLIGGASLKATDFLAIARAAVPGARP